MTGPSGSGKSGLALRMIALGARLVADDRTELCAESGGRLLASAPAAIRGLIEARGVGLLRADPLDRVPLALVVDLAREEPDRLPPHRQITLLGCTLPLVLRPRNPHLPESLLLWLADGRQA
jgi:HPr kinase/phosphorylase